MTGMLGRIQALALATLGEAVRSQVFVNLGLFAVLALGGALVLDQLTLGDRGRALVDLGLASLSMVDALLVMFMAVQTLGGEEDRRTLMTILVRPVRRAEVLVGKFAGIVLLLGINIAGAVAVLWLGTLMSGGATPAHLLLAGLGLWLEAMVITAVTLVFCTFAGTTVAAMLGLGTYVSGLLAGELRTFAGREDAGTLGPLVSGFYYAVPNLQRLDFHAQNPTGADITWSVLYAVLYAGAALSLACAIFERRDLR